MRPAGPPRVRPRGRLALDAIAAALAIGGLMWACAPAHPPLPRAPMPHGDGVAVRAEPARLDPGDPSRDRLGDFAWAGGVVLTSEQTARLHGLSDLLVDPDGRLTAVSDQGDLLTARLILDGEGRLTGLSDARLTALPGLDGKPLPGKTAADAEGLAVLADGARLVSFEQEHRIWAYPAGGGPPRPAPFPKVEMPANSGFEALGADPAAGPDAYLVGGEESGRVWTCRLSGPCAEAPRLEKDGDFGLVAVRRLPDGSTAWLLRAFDPLRGVRSELRIVGPEGVRGRLQLARPLTVDNFEGLAAIPIPGGYRFYLLSDDNFNRLQRTLLVAFDWRPTPKEPAK